MPAQVVALRWNTESARWEIVLHVEEQHSQTLGRLIGTRRGLNAVLAAKE
jgi:hypothetical protein